MVTLEISPILGSLLLHQFPAIGCNTVEGRLPEIRIPFVQFDDSHFLLSGMITHLRGLYHRCIAPLLGNCGTDNPSHRIPFRSCRKFRTKHKPTVIMVYPSVIQHQISLLTLNRNLCQLILRIEHKLFSRGKRCRDNIIGNHRIISLPVQKQLVQAGFPLRIEVSDMLHIGGLLHGGPHRLMRENTRPVIHNPGLAQQGRRHQLQIETEFPGKAFRNRPVQINSQYQIVLLPFHLDSIAESKIRIEHRIEPRHMLGRVRIAQCDTDFVGSLIHHPFPHLGQSLPLPLRNLETHITACGPAVSIQNQGDTPLVSFRIDITENHHIGPVVFKIPRRVNLEVLGLQTCTKHQ